MSSVDCQRVKMDSTDNVTDGNATEKSEVADKSKLTKKREDYIEWPDYFMAIAMLSAQRSKDPNTQVGACIINAENKIVGIGYNGMPNGCSDDLLPWSRTGASKLDTKYPYGNFSSGVVMLQVGACIVSDEKKIVGIGYNGMPNGCSDDVLPWAKKADDPLDTKFPYVCHAEMNAIMNKNSADVKNCTIYVALFPCNECAKLIIQSGIKKVVYLSEKNKGRPEFIASTKLLTMAGVEISKFEPKTQQLIIDFSAVENVPKRNSDVND